MGLSPTVAIASRVQRSGKTFTKVYVDHVHLQDEYAKKCAEYDRMDRTVVQVLAQIKEQVSYLIIATHPDRPNLSEGAYPCPTTRRVRTPTIRGSAARISARRCSR